MAVIEAIQTTYLEADASYIVWTSIPDTYEHLEIRASIQTNTSSTSTGTSILYLNNDATNGNYYTRHQLKAQNTSATANASETHQQTGYLNSKVVQQSYAALHIVLYDYANTNKMTTFTMTQGAPEALTPSLTFTSSIWWRDSGGYTNTDAIDQINIGVPGSQLTRGSSATLYGITG